MVPTELFNHRLKDTFMTAAWNVVHYNPDSHVAGYHRNLVKAGMSPLAATKRVARALVRVIYRKLSTLDCGEITDAPTEDEKRREKATWQAVLPAVAKATQATYRFHPHAIIGLQTRRESRKELLR